MTRGAASVDAHATSRSFAGSRKRYNSLDFQPQAVNRGTPLGRGPALRMPDSIEISKVVRFETFEVNVKTGELRKGGVTIRSAGAGVSSAGRAARTPRQARHARGPPTNGFGPTEPSSISKTASMAPSGDCGGRWMIPPTSLALSKPCRGEGIALSDRSNCSTRRDKLSGFRKAPANERTVAHYRLLEKLGEGGMGVVYKALDTKLNRTVALKFLAPRLTLDPDAKKRFRREAQAAAAVDHPNICTVYEINEVDGQIFIAMAYIEGPSLDKKIAGRSAAARRSLSTSRSKRLRGLQAAHENGVVHRDIKGANILLTTEGQVKIADFGLAQLASPDQLTKTGTTLGTPAYRSPEQARWEKLDRRTDIWSLGVVLYEMVCGQLTFSGRSRAGRDARHLCMPTRNRSRRCARACRLNLTIWSTRRWRKSATSVISTSMRCWLTCASYRRNSRAGSERLRTTPGRPRPRRRQGRSDQGNGPLRPRRLFSRSPVRPCGTSCPQPSRPSCPYCRFRSPVTRAWKTAPHFPPTAI